MSGCRFIQLTKDRWTVVSGEDYEAVTKYRWFTAVCDGAFYARRNLKTHEGGGRKGRKSRFLHTEILNPQTGFEVDHINRNTLDNRRENLRIVDSSQNKQNTGRRSKWGYRGVSRSPSKSMRWTARIKKGELYFHLGSFSSPEDAARAYDRKARELYGSVLYLNFPDK